uniref:Uncharacterized protein n=1 Tax=Panagrellus redivivus TaxID=6233 RepID=A0A7E4ZTF2_PANRE
MSDPRICRGSVIARQREEATRTAREIEQRQAEERYRMEVVRNRLNMALNDSKPSISSYSRSKATAMAGATVNRITRGAIRAETSVRLAKLAGKTGKAAIAEWIEENGIDISPRAKPIPRRLSPIRDLTSPKAGVMTPQRPLNGAKRVASVKRAEHQHRGGSSDVMRGKSMSKSGPNLKNVAFVPLKEDASPRRNGGPHKVVPSIPLNTSPRQSHRLPPQRRFMPKATLTPPQSPYGPIIHSDAAVQTDEAFDTTFDPIIKELAATAISDALKNLREEHEFKTMEEQTEKLLNIVVTEKRRNSELNLTILKHIKAEHEIDKDRQQAWQQLKALDCRRMATEFIEEILETCTENLANRGLIEDTATVRSVAADTRQLEQYKKDLQMATLEIERDFFPYVYAKAEQIFVHKLADSYLRDALFSKKSKHRAEARKHLNEQLHKYQKMTKGVSLSEYSRNSIPM